MISKNSTTYKPRRDEVVAGGCSWEPSSCDRSCLLPELCSLGQDNGQRSMSEIRSCMSAEGEIPVSHQHQQNGSDNGGKTAEEEPSTRGEVNVFVDGNPDIQNREGGGNGDEGTVVVRKKRTWTAEEDEKLKKAVEEHGSGNWMIIERCSGLGRTSKSCRLRWTNHLRPNLKKGSFSEAEERTVVMLHQKYGNKWSFIASKLPGRTDNEVKNFWHGRLRRCRKQYVDIYPPNLVDEKSPLDDLNNSRSRFHDHNIGLAATSNTSPVSQFPFVKPQQNITSCNTNQKLSSSTSNQSQISSLNQILVSSPHGLSSSNQLQSPKLYTTKMHSLPINITESHLPSNLHSTLTSEPPPASKFSSPEQGRTISAPSSSVSSHKLQISSLASQVSTPFNSITEGSPAHTARQHISLKQPTTSSSKLDTLSLPFPVSCNQGISQVNIPTTAAMHSPSELKVTTPPPYQSYFQVNPSVISSSLTSFPICNSSNLELPLTSPPLESLSQTWLNSSLEMAEPYSLGFELPLPQSSPSNFNRAFSSLPFAVVPELPSFQSLENASPVPKVTINLHNAGTENCKDAHIQDASAKTDLSYLNLTEENILDKCLENILPSRKIFENGITSEKTNEGALLYQSKRREGFTCEGQETINSSGSQVPRKNLQRNRMLDKHFKTEIARGKISRREGLLAEISKTGVLLIESAKKERIVSKLLNQSSKPDIVLSQSPKTENLQCGEISKIKDFLGESLNIEDLLTDIYNLRDEKSIEDALLASNSTLLETKNLQETLYDKSSSESVLFPSYEQDEMHDWDVIGRQTNETNLLKPDGIGTELNSVQDPLDQVLDEICRRDALPGLEGQDHALETVDAVFGHITSMNQLKSGNGQGNLNYVGPCEGDCLNKSLRSECTDNLKKEFTEQVSVRSILGDRSNGEGLLAVQDQHMTLDDSDWGIGQYIFSNIPSSVQDVESSCIKPSAGVLLDEGQRTENSLSRKGSKDENSGGGSLGEISIERVHGTQDL